eukprot:361411-Chlamydomonas_euryale.AAC.3
MHLLTCSARCTASRGKFAASYTDTRPASTAAVACGRRAATAVAPPVAWAATPARLAASSHSRRASRWRGRGTCSLGLRSLPPFCCKRHASVSAPAAASAASATARAAASRYAASPASCPASARSIPRPDVTADGPSSRDMQLGSSCAASNKAQAAAPRSQLRQ